MAFVTKNGFDVEHASNLLIYENLFPEIQHLNGKGVTDKYTKASDVKNVTFIDVMRILPYAPRFRKLGATNNGKWHNAKNEGGYNNAPESEHYTIPVDLFYDEGVQISSMQTLSTPVEFKSIIMAQLIKAAGMSINVITHAKQYEGFFRDSFSATPTASQISTALFAYKPDKSADQAGSAVDAYIAANAELTNGVPEIGAFVVPMGERQAFISTNYDRIMKRQYQTNASEAAAQILANGYINPFTGENAKINVETGLCGMYDGVPMFLINRVIRGFVYVALGLSSSTKYITGEITTGAGLSELKLTKATFATQITTSGTYQFIYDGTVGSESWQLGESDVTLANYGIAVTGTPADNDKITVAYYAVTDLLDYIDGEIIYGAGTVRGIVGPSIQANANFMYGGVYILPQMKVGVEVLNGKTIKMIVNTALTPLQVKLIKESIVFTPIDGVVVTANDIFGSGIFNDNLQS